MYKKYLCETTRRQNRRRAWNSQRRNNMMNPNNWYNSYNQKFRAWTYPGMPRSRRREYPPMNRGIWKTRARLGDDQHSRHDPAIHTRKWETSRLLRSDTIARSTFSTYAYVPLTSKGDEREGVARSSIPALPARSPTFLILKSARAGHL